MDTTKIETLAQEIADKLEKYNEHIDYLSKDAKKMYPQSVKKQVILEDKKMDILNLSPKDFVKLYKENPEKIENSILREFGVDPAQKVPNYQPQKPNENEYLVVNLPLTTNPEDILKRVKENENIADILTDLGGQ